MKVRLLTKLPIETGASRYRLILAPNIDAATRPYSPYNPYIPYSRDNRQTIEHLTCARFYGNIYITILSVPTLVISSTSVDGAKAQLRT